MLIRRAVSPRSVVILRVPNKPNQGTHPMSAGLTPTPGSLLLTPKDQTMFGASEGH
jgi:hypothetical protein